MGGNSTSQSALLRDESHTRSTYDLRSWQGLTDVLRAAKQKLTPEKHAVFRDLVLRYAQQGGDSALKNEIDAVLATLETSQASAALHSESISQSQKVVRPAASRSSRVGRPVPQFTVRQSVLKPVTTPVSIPPVTPTPPQPASIPKPPTPPTPIPEPKPEPEPVAVPPAPVFEPPAPRTSEIAKSEPVVSPAPVVSSLSPQRDVISSDSAIPDHVASSSKEKIQPFTNLSPAARLAALTKDAPKAAPKVVTVPKENVVTPKSEPATFQQTKYTQKKVGSVSIQALAASGIDTDEYEVHQSELASPKITKALHELLDEWNIFNASGFLGIGPSGAEHPLYIRLAPLSMGEILTGRYEGADRKVNTVVHDYVNAWRHEQGIAYTPSETFEHYLRRVVQRIQKRQGTPA